MIDVGTPVAKERIMNPNVLCGLLLCIGGCGIVDSVGACPVGDTADDGPTLESAPITQEQAGSSELKRIEARLKDETIESILSLGKMMLRRIESESEKEKAFAILGFDEEGPSSIGAVIERAGGLDAYRKRVTALLESKEERIRAFAAGWLGVLGQKESVPDLVKLLQSKSARQEHGEDRTGAAVGLGLLGAQEHAPKLAALLTADNSLVRRGAAFGLGLMKAVKFAPDVAKLINPEDLAEDEAVVGVAAAALAEMGAAAYADRIAWLLRTGSAGTRVAAMGALAKLRAKQHAKDIAPLLKDKIVKGHAACALALLDAQSYKKEIAALLDDKEPGRSRWGMIALGILRAREYEDKIVSHLEAPKHLHDPYQIASYAGWSLILMESSKYVPKLAAQPDPSVLDDLPREVRQRAFESWKKLKSKGAK
jgi:HEAT repeat protein